MHHVHEVLRDGHAEPRALDAADGGGALALEGVEDVLDEFGAHANARVRHGEAVAPVADWRAGQLVQRHLDESAGIRELQGVAQQVQENLVDAQLVAAHLGVADALGIDGEVQLPRARLGLNDAVEIVQKIDEVVGLLIQRDLAALDVAHVQNVVDEAQEMRAGGLDLVQVLLHFLRLIEAAGSQSGEAHDGVHGRADVVGHVREEGALGGVGLVGLGQRLFQQGLLLHLLAGLHVDAAQAQHHVVSLGPIAAAHDGGLAVLRNVAVVDAIVHMDTALVGQARDEAFRRKRVAQHGLVLFHDSFIDVSAEAAVKIELAGEQLVQLAKPVAADAQGLARFGVQAEGTYEQVVLGKRLDEIALAALLAHFFLFLVRVIEQVTLQEQLAIAFDELHVAHDMHDVAVVVAHAVLGAHRVADVLQGSD